ncbi:MAG: 16S rRNA (guanine(527)-N(7))-methyltransferase RsmG [Atopobiaceae bacterium]|nr:16S rRNA (guanine(527)-N(7))-methyltransferase RsmG [Atopobiaceae bacterium]
MICNSDNIQLLQELLSTYGIETTGHERRLLLQHLDLVVEKNKVMNLTRIVDPLDAIVRHVVDSLLLVPNVKAAQLPSETSFVDIGTGAGFPGIPLGIVTGYKGLLIDSVGKKANAVEEFIEALGLTDMLAAKSIRVEDLAKKKREQYQLVVARAVADLGVLVEYASPLLSKSGCLIVSKANITDEELERGTATSSLVGLKSVSRETYELPYEMGHREILTFKKISASKIKLPRQVGMAKHKPLVQ